MLKLWVFGIFLSGYFLLPVAAQTTNEVILNVTVLSGNDGFVNNLTAADFRIYDGNKEQTIKSVTQEDVPVSIGIMVDLSASMEIPKFSKSTTIDLIKNGLTEFVKQSNPSNEYFIMEFGRESKMVLDLTKETKNVLKTLEQLSNAQLVGNTAFYDALYQGIERISNGKYDKRVLLLITDGQDNESEKQSGELKRILKEKNIIVHSVCLVDRSLPDFQFLRDPQDYLVGIGELTGGWNLFAKTGEEVGLAFLYLADDLRHQYQIIVDLTSQKKGRSWHKLKVKASDDKKIKATFRTRQGVFMDNNSEQ